MEMRKPKTSPASLGAQFMIRMHAAEWPVFVH